MSENRVVVGVFADRSQAEQAMHDLHAANFYNLGFIVRDQDHITQMLPEGEVGEVGEHEQSGEGHPGRSGAVTGGVVGGVVGAAAALLIPGIGPAIAGGILTTILSGAAIGAAAGSLIGAFIHIGVSEEDARYYEQEVQSGRTIVIVQADDDPLEAFNIMERNRAFNARQPSANLDPGATVELEPLENNPQPGGNL